MASTPNDQDAQLRRCLEATGASITKEDDERVYMRIDGKEHELHKQFPLIVAIELSAYCNLVCLGCPSKGLTRRRGFMEASLFRRIIDEIAQHRTRSWFHFMGEPLMHPEVFGLLEYAREKQLPYFGMSTNALLLTRENIERILDSGLRRFEISLDSLDTEVLGQLRPGGSPEQIIENAHEFFRIKYEREQRFPITSVSCRVMEENATEVDSFRDHWNSILREPDFVLALAWNSWGGSEGLAHATYDVPDQRLPCLKLWKSCVILQDGRLVTCDPMFDGQVVMGDVAESRIEDIWNGPEYVAWRKKHLQGDFSDLPVCSGCTDWYRELINYENITAKGEMSLADINKRVWAGPSGPIRNDSLNRPISEQARPSGPRF